MHEATNELIVTTAQGEVRGLRGGGIRRFFSIPYAAPPVDERRFKLPEPRTAWDGVRDAASFMRGRVVGGGGGYTCW